MHYDNDAYFRMNDFDKCFNIKFVLLRFNATWNANNYDFTPGKEYF